MTEQEENELICEKLLGWERIEYRDDTPAWEVPSKAGEFQPTQWVTPTFTTWADAGLILEALAKHDVAYIVGSELKPNCFLEWSDHDVDEFGETAPLAIRAAALAYIQQVKS